MDRNGKKAKVPRAESERHAQRSDMKGSRRDVPGAATNAAKGKAGDAATPRAGGKGGRR